MKWRRTACPLNPKRITVEYPESLGPLRCSIQKPQKLLNFRDLPEL